MPVITKAKETKKSYYVREGLVVKLTEEKTYISGEVVELSDLEYARHAHQVETIKQFDSRNNLKSTAKTETGDE